MRLLEASELQHFVTLELVASEPAITVSSAIHTISLEKVTASNATYIKWTTDFSNDATSEVVMDSQYKKLDAFKELAGALGV
jgi:hypothetical protein